MKKIQEILNTYPAVRFTGNADQLIARVVELEKLNGLTDALSWCNVRNIEKMNSIASGTVICPDLPGEFIKQDKVNYIEVKEPRRYFMQVLKLLFPDAHKVGISASAKIHPGVRIGSHVSIGEHVVIDEGCEIGEGTTIGHNTVIFRNTKIGKSVLIGCNNTIGGVGFGYEKNEDGEYEVLPHIGNVVIEDEVEIAHNVCIDRAVLSSTRICKNAKIDNQVHIAHNVIIGENSLIIANSMIAGSTVIGKNVWVAPCSAVLNKLTIGDNAFIGMSSVVLKDIPAGESVFGNPARTIPPKK